MDEEGFLYFIGRRDEMMKTSGYRVSPTEVEEILYATKMVGECVAFGVDDDRLGQAIQVIATPSRQRTGCRRLARRMPRPHAGLHGPGRYRGAQRAACRAIRTARSTARRSRPSGSKERRLNQAYPE
jgi:acyl-CoA synthetase (AMP-forming)/AMP-acid ligase II